MARGYQGKRLKVAKGQLILREGDTDTNAYRVMSGYVDVYKQRDGKRMKLARLGPGQFFGEMNLVLETARTANVEAIEDCVIRVISQKTFNRLLHKDPEASLPLLRVLFERLRIMTEKYLLALKAQGAAPLLDVLTTAQPTPSGTPTQQKPGTTPCPRGQLVLTGLSEVAEKMLRKRSLEISQFPFRIGRRVDDPAADTLNLNDLYVPDSQPFQVSRNHCAIDMAPDDSFYIMDRGSTQGTIVNGKPIGRQAGILEVSLTKQTNSLVLGLPSSQYRFNLTINSA